MAPESDSTPRVNLSIINRSAEWRCWAACLLTPSAVPIWDHEQPAVRASPHEVIKQLVLQVGKLLLLARLTWTCA